MLFVPIPFFFFLFVGNYRLRLGRKMKNRFEINKLILYVYLDSVYLFLFYIRTKKFKNM